MDGEWTRKSIVSEIYFLFYIFANIILMLPCTFIHFTMIDACCLGTICCNLCYELASRYLGSGKAVWFIRKVMSGGLLQQKVKGCNKRRIF